MAWKHVGGGCMFSGGGPLPCDDTYRNTETGEEVSFESTYFKHATMPLEVESLDEIRAMSDVREFYHDPSGETW